jgi:hypothetical protein
LKPPSTITAGPSKPAEGEAAAEVAVAAAVAAEPVLEAVAEKRPAASWMSLRLRSR